MSETFTCCSIERLLKWILAGDEAGYIFGIHKGLFFNPLNCDGLRMKRYGKILETPIGVAAGPHTQLSQNIISAWLTGARYMELKTVQTLDELEVTKPCIDMTDEGYNCEWSQELNLNQSYDEYLNAWIILHILKDKFGWGNLNEPGFIFNISVGYNLEGILNENVQKFLDKIADCSQAKKEKIALVSKLYPRVKDIEIPDQISDNVTISTMHGCPPHEIEKIGQYFIEKRKLNTTIKLNPTLLGTDQLRDILNKKLGYQVTVPDLAFEHDLKYEDGVRLIKNLRKTAEENNVEFNLKLTNTLETLNRKQNLPDNEEMVYMSGRPLHAISINLAARLQNEFKGKLDISFSAGVDCFNAVKVLTCNIKPITMCSDILKPGGYGRLVQYLEEIQNTLNKNEMKSVEGLFEHGTDQLNRYAKEVISEPAYHKDSFPYDHIKTSQPLLYFDCAKAPCTETCPAEQDIPSYLYFAAKGEYEKAYQVIMKTNPFPNVQGKVCHHPCQGKCTRMNYDTPIQIRNIKRFIADKNSDFKELKTKPLNGLSIAIIGAGPSGLSCAYFLALEGFSVDIFEEKDFSGGMAASAIPCFRLDEESLKKDIDRILALGVKIHYHFNVDKKKFREFQEKYDYIYVAVGAKEATNLPFLQECKEGVCDQLDFLSQMKSGDLPVMGKMVVVIGGGNSAIDSARSARRLVGEDGKVSILYRRTRKEMPAATEEVEDAEKEGIQIIELASPEKILFQNGKMTGIECIRMELGEPDSSGRPRPIKIEDSGFEIKADTIITAVGQKVILDFLPESELKRDPKTGETQIKNVFIGGDAARGAASLIEAIGDGRNVAHQIVELGLKPEPKKKDWEKRDYDIDQHSIKQTRRMPINPNPDTKVLNLSGFDLISSTMDEDQVQKDAGRCLSCDQYCNVCVTVCPNRANLSYKMDRVGFPIQVAKKINGKSVIETVTINPIEQEYQILNIGDFCNECGNCNTFCPSAGSPYRDKPKFYLTRDGFDIEDNGFFLFDQTIYTKENGKECRLIQKGNRLIFDSRNVRVTLKISTMKAENIIFKSEEIDRVDLKPIAEMALLFKTLKDHELFL